MAWDDGLEKGTPAYQIASTENTHVRVVAGPGTGKSFAMKRRVARLLEEGIDPKAILPVTFTRVAAEDLHRELVNMDTDNADELEGTTLHSLALKMLSRNHVLEVTGRHPRPLNDFELEPMLADLKGHGGKREIKKKLNAYHAAWARLQDDDPADVEEHRDLEFETDLVSWLEFHRGMLIGEVIPYLYGYLRDHPHCPERSELAHILVDEFQDLNKVEQEILGFLGENANICIVGDDDQSIYSFKFAHPQGILEWCEKHDGAEDLALTDCRRCPHTVVRIANHLIQTSPTRIHDRALAEFADNGEGEVRIIQYKHLDDEVQGICNIVEELMGAGTHPGEIIILAQRRKIGTYIYEELLNRNILAKSYYQEAELDDEDTQERFALLKLASDNDDRVALRWLIGKGSAEWYKGGYRRIREHCEANGLEPWTVLQSLSDKDISLPYTNLIIEAFEAVRDRVAELAALFEEDGIAALLDDLFPDDDDRWRDLRELARQIAGLEEEDVDEFEGDLSEFVGELSYAIAQPEIPSEIQDVRIMSLHKSKGLSAAATIVASCVEGVLPKRPDDSLTRNEKLAEIEEQRRLFFVGVSRVKARPEEGEPGRLFLTYSASMAAADAHQSGIEPARFEYDQATLQASRFLKDLGPYAPKREAG